ncbi:ATP-binding cassette sub-family A member 2-like isoform X2 [Orbicella faveolata]|uniref:ATP-binding cassette sub-family A member 2-like isoform X2 n=1 Tax=Orbicella faveolata TaxID=48498 RepID=UPI0009E58420|nr:ATP-binding cassette sub-family A member 2-like isoform X2 [Orbicella faveolata]
MGFGLQLRLLLWKNFTLKKRAPITVLIEVLIPLVLFLILMSIRFRREPDFVPEEVFPVRALPSSGIIPLLQQFCNNKDKDEHGFPVHPNASIGTVLDHIADILSSPGLSTADDLKTLPQDYDEFHKNLNKMVSHAQNVDNFTIREILTDPSEVQQFMQNLSIPPSVAEGLLNSTVNSRELAKYVGVHGKNILKQLPWSGNHSVPGDNLNRFPTQSSSPGGADLLGLLLFGTMSNLMGAAPRPPSPPHTPATNFTIQQPSDTTNVQPNTSSCNVTELERVLVFKGANQKETLQHLCQLTPQQAQVLASYLQNRVDRKAAMQKLNVTREDVIAYNKSYTKLRGDLKNLTEFVHLVQKGVELAQLLRLNLSFTQHLENKTTWQRRKIYLREMWKNLGPIICGPDPDAQPKKKVIDHMYDYRCRTSGCRTRAMRLMLYLLLHNPKIAYSPNGTAADKVIEKANRTFSDIEKLQHLAEDWLNTSQKIRRVLKLNDSQYYLGLVLNSKHKCLRRHNNMAHNLTGYKPSDYFGQYQGLDELLTRSCDNTNPLITQLDTIDNVARLWLEMASHLNLNIFKGFKDEKSLVNYALNINNSRGGDTSKVVAGIVFMNIKVNASLPPHVKYKIRMNATYFTPATDSIRDPYWMPGPQSWNQRYYDLGFTWLQDQIERAIVDLHAERDVIKPAVYMHEMPYPCYVRDNFMFIIEHMMPLCMTVSWIYTVALAVQAIVYEKEQRLKEVMKMMGLSNAVHWVAWFITSLCVMSITVFLLVITLKYGKVLYYSDPLVVWVFLMVFAVVTIVLCFLISVFFSKAKISSACGGIIYFLTYLPYVFISIREEAGSVNVSGKEKMAASLFSTSAFGLGARYFAIYEEEGVGMQWSNLGKSPVQGDDFNLLKVMYCMMMDTVIYAILVWYIEAVHPGSYGLPRPWYFICQPSYWFGHNTQACPKMSRRTFQMMTADELEDMPQAQGLLAYEREPIHLSLGVTIENLVKVYKEGKKLAVDGLTLNLYEGQITSFLGHNGAGKTTTMSILTGLFPPTAGTAYVYGCDIRVDMDKIRRSLGMCPQHNVLFDRMTVDEHLWFYARLKGMPEKDVKREMDQLVMDVGLPTKRHCAVETLSGGMKRKLSVAMAFAAGSRTVILDEPTAGVDPYARRAIWDLLIKYKKGRTILLSTHFMDEADLLGDRIAIVSNGKLRCVGSPLFLKSHFGDGYHLTLVKKRERTPQGSIVNVHVSSTGSSQALETTETTSSENTLQPDHPNFGEDHVKKVTNFIKSHVPAARLEQNTTQEFTFVLPDNSVKRGGFEIFFSDLEAKQDELGIDSFGLTDTSLEEVFLKVTDVTSRDESELNSSKSEDSLNPGESSSTMLSGDSAGLGDEWDEDIPGDGEIELNDLPNVRYDAREQLLSPEIQEEATDQYADHTPSNKEFQGVGSRTLTGVSLKLQQFYALVIKRFHYARRNFKGVISQILLPAIFITIAMVMALSFPKQPDQPPLELTPSMFPRPNYIPFANEAKGVNQLASRLDKTLTLLSGVGATCCLRSVNLTTTEVKPSKEDLAQLFNHSCSVSIDEVSDEYFKPSNLHLSYIYTNGSNVSHSVTHKDTGRGCRCSPNKTAYVCDRGAAGPHPKELVTITLDTLQNITGRNISKYLLYTTETFRLHRYGSLSFGEVVSFVPQKLDKVKIASVRRLAIREAVKAWYNNKGYHALPTYLNVMNNAILRASLAKGKGNPAAYGITVFNHPFNKTDSNQLSARYMRQGTDLVIAIFVIIAMSFVPASFVVFLVTERSSKAKHLQFVSGVDPVIYWLSNYVWDLCNYLIPACACITLLHVFKVPAYSSDTNFPAVVCLFLLYGWSITPIMYPGAFFFSEASSAYVFMIVVNLFVGVTATVTTFILQLFPDDVLLTKIYDALRVINLGFPNYCLGHGLMDLAYNQYLTEYYTQIGEYEKIRDPFEWMLTTRNLVCMAVEGVVFFILTVLIEFRFFIKRRRTQVSKEPIEGLDEDVAAEKERVLSGGASRDLIRIENLTKVYYARKRGKHLAVDRLCFGVPKGECFGLLGVNGAGKTSTFKMLTGDTSMTAGNAFLNSHSIASEMQKVHKCMGFCPQFDALFDELTASEHLTLYARLRGVPEKELHKVVSWAIKKLALTHYANRPSKTYSGGNKRKLSTAMALIGNPPIIFLDEPTTGMDPHARRFLWNLILEIIKDGRSVILTSHSMEECEALCTRMAIMVNGQFKCLGSCQHLKNRFGEGYIITVRIQGDLPNLEPLYQFFSDKFPHATLKEHHHNIVQYQLPSGVMALSEVFGHIESSYETLKIEDYSVSQTTLDNVFINFARTQTDEIDFDDQSASSRKTGARLSVRRRAERLRDLWSVDVQFSPLEEEDGERSIGDNEDWQVTFADQARLSFETSEDL